MTDYTSHGHAPDSPRIPPWQMVKDQPERSEEAYREHIARLMARWVESKREDKG